IDIDIVYVQVKDNPYGLDFNEISITGEILFAILYDDLYAFQDKIKQMGKY
ncbi:unnamed protein product, partial [marine sediment metagenome]